MRFKDVFSIIGPSMIGPSSSHTAGAVRLGRTARQLAGGQPEEADVYFYGSFADTYLGHGTDLAVAAGLLNYDTDDARIRHAIREAAEAGLAIRFHPEKRAVSHPNTATILLKSEDRTNTLTGCSIGGGNVEILSVNGFDVKFTAMYPTLLIFHRDRPGMIAEMSEIMKIAKINISYMEVDRKARNGEALTVIESDETFNPDVVAQIERLADVQQVRMIDLSRKEESS